MNVLRFSIAAGALAFGGVLFAQTAAPAPDAGSAAQAPSAAPAPQAPAGPGWGPRDGRGPGDGRMMHRQGERHEHHGTQAHDGHHGMHRHHAGHGMHGPRAGFMRHMDANRDGRLGRDEVLAAQQRQLAMFDRADADRDGALTRDEMRAAREAMREEFRKRRGGMHRDGEPRRPADPAPASVLPSAERGV